ncbi:LysR substrate-binding domain-containing protein [Trinickia dinghuensis]|nr:LysR substrate-binding domain-containing protein [Trinickia dinghuensis]
MTEAAKMLFVTQSAVSKIMREFEQEVGFELFSRRKGGLLPTAEAKALCVEVERVFVGLDQVVRTAERIRLGQQGRLRIVAMSTVSCGFLQSVIAEFREQHPKVSVSIETYNSHEVTNLVASGLFDLGFATSPVDTDQVVAESLWKVRCVCILPPQHRLARRRTVTPADLRDENFISLGSGNTTRLAIDSAFRSENIHRTTEMEAGWSIAVSAMVSSGLGVSVIDPFTAQVAKQCGCVVRPFSPAIDYSFAILRPQAATASALVDDFIQAVRRRLAQLKLVDAGR